MGRYKDYREPRGRGFDDDYTRQDRVAERRPTNLGPSAPPSEPVEAIVKLFKADKGFGFIGQDGGGKDVFVHATALARAGLSGLAEGQRVRMQIGQGLKGLEAQTIKLLD